MGIAGLVVVVVVAAVQPVVNGAEDVEVQPA